jgi:hypothetical protein
MPLLDAETFYQHQCLLGPAACVSCEAMLHPPAEWAPRRHWTAHMRPQDFPAGPPPVSFQQHQQNLRPKMAVALDVLSALVVVNDGRWVVHCPDPGCSEAQIASRGDRRFFCTRCLNREAGGYWRQVWWPDDAEVDQVERVLGERMDVKARQWWPSDGQGRPREEVAVQLRQIQRAPISGFERRDNGEAGS